MKEGVSEKEEKTDQGGGSEIIFSSRIQVQKDTQRKIEELAVSKLAASILVQSLSRKSMNTIAQTAN